MAGEQEDLPQRDEEESTATVVKPFLEHLEDLRWMLIKMLAALGIAMVLCFSFAPWLMAVIILPLKRVTGNPEPYLRTLEVTGGFTLAMKLAFYAGLVVACPFLLYYLAQFILPALTQRERRMLTPAFAGGTGLFLAGAGLAYFVVVPAGLNFFIQYNKYLGIRSEWTINNYVAFVSHMTLAFGLCFELPLVVLILAKLGLVTPEFLRQKRPLVVVLILALAAIVTPTTDPFNMALLAVPMAILYESCIWIARFMERRKRTKD